MKLLRFLTLPFLAVGIAVAVILSGLAIGATAVSSALLRAWSRQVEAVFPSLEV